LHTRRLAKSRTFLSWIWRRWGIFPGSTTDYRRDSKQFDLDDRVARHLL